MCVCVCVCVCVAGVINALQRRWQTEVWLIGSLRDKELQERWAPACSYPPAGSHYLWVWGSHLASLHPSLHRSPNQFLSNSRLVMDLILWLERGQFYLSGALHLHNDLHKYLHLTPRPTLFRSLYSFHFVSGVLLWLVYPFLFLSSSRSLFLCSSHYRLCNITTLHHTFMFPPTDNTQETWHVARGNFYAVSNHPEISGITFTPTVKKIQHLHVTDKIFNICHANSRRI